MVPLWSRMTRRFLAKHDSDLIRDRSGARFIDKPYCFAIEDKLAFSILLVCGNRPKISQGELRHSLWEKLYDDRRKRLPIREQTRSVLVSTLPHDRLPRGQWRTRMMFRSLFAPTKPTPQPLPSEVLEQSRKASTPHRHATTVDQIGAALAEQTKVNRSITRPVHESAEELSLQTETSEFSPKLRARKSKAKPYERMLGKITAENELRTANVTSNPENLESLTNLDWLHKSAEPKSMSLVQTVKPWLIALLISGVAVTTSVMLVTGLPKDWPKLDDLTLEAVANKYSASTTQPTKLKSKTPQIPSSVPSTAKKRQGRLQ